VQDISDDSFATFKRLAAADPQTNLLVRRMTADTPEKFLGVLYEDLDQIIQTLQERKQNYCNAGEDVITMALVDMLRQRQYIAEHDSKIGGHVDVVIRGRDPKFLWLGEAKRDNGPAWLEEGMEQLCNRYSDGSTGRDHGGILVYIQGMKARQIFQNWKDSLAKSTQFENLAISDCPRNPSAAFISTHTHNTSGLSYHVRHMAIGLYHKPTK
jgi:hypothetical protein